MKIAIDFDGTVVTNDFPKVGKDIGSTPILRKLVENGHQLILYTTRAEHKHILDAINWFKEKGINLFALWKGETNANINKCQADLFIDAKALGCPLKEDSRISKEMFADWSEIELMLLDMGLIK